MKRMLRKIAVSITVFLAVGMLVSGDAAARAAAPKAPKAPKVVPKVVPKAKKETICHARGKGKFNMISVAKTAVPAHIAHGDVYPGTVVLGTKYVGDNCSVTDTVRVDSGELALDSGTAGSLAAWASVSCPVDTTVVGGGYEPLDGFEALPVTWSEAAEPGSTSGLYPAYPHYAYTPPETGWVVQNGDTPQTLNVYAICAPAP